jgi:transposase InsO family protein
VSGKEVVTIPSPIASFQIFEELGIDFIGPLTRDVVGNSYIFNAVCSTTHYCELFAVEAPTAVIAAHCLLSVVARYGCFRQIRSDRGTHFVNEVIVEFLRLFEIQHVLTLAERPQANAIVERNGGEVM